MTASARLLDIAVTDEAPIAPRLGAALAARVRGVIAPSRAAAWSAGVEQARAAGACVEAFGGDQLSLGRAWYTHLEQGRSAAYFDDVAASDARVEKFCPGLQDAMRTLAARVVGAPVMPREGWCGPGVHVFPAGSPVAKKGGTIHFDTEGLTPAHAAEHAAALTLVVMLAPPPSGGGLRVWDARYRGSDAYEDADLERDAVTVDYGAGDLVVIDSYRLHQIQPFATSRADRISATVHVAFALGRWEAWF